LLIQAEQNQQEYSFSHLFLSVSGANVDSRNRDIRKRAPRPPPLMVEARRVASTSPGWAHSVVMLGPASRFLSLSLLQTSLHLFIAPRFVLPTHTHTLPPSFSIGGGSDARTRLSLSLSISLTDSLHSLSPLALFFTHTRTHTHTHSPSDARTHLSHAASAAPLGNRAGPWPVDAPATRLVSTKSGRGRGVRQRWKRARISTVDSLHQAIFALPSHFVCPDS
jgi:hypothetical protein